MVRRKSVKPLRHFCLKALPALVTGHVRRMAQKASAQQWFGMLTMGDVTFDKEQTLRLQVDETREFITSQVLWYDYEDVFKALLRGVEDAVTQTRRNWKMSSNMEQYRAEMDAMAVFSSIVVLPMMRRFDFRDVPKSLRSRLTEQFEKFTELRQVIIGGGGHMFRNLSPNFAAGLRQMHKLREFSCKHDCNTQLLEALARGCSDTLIALDLEDAKGVDDACLEPIAAFFNLEELNIFNTSIGEETKAKLLLSLPKLTRLIRGDFLCDALGWIDYMEQSPRLLLTEFFPSQEYYFHEDWQMEMAVRFCPYISKVFFIFHEQCVPSYQVLEPFEYLRELDLFGGSFYDDGVARLLEVRGAGIVRLNLMCVRGVDYRAIAKISVDCPKLESLGLTHCELGEFRPRGDPNSDAEYERRVAHAAMAREARQTATTFAHVEEVVVLSPCRAQYLAFLLGRCPNVRRISLGQSVEVDDEVVAAIYSRHGLARLEEFHLERCTSTALTLNSLALLINECPELSVVSDIQAWAGVEPKEVGTFREMCHESNYALDTRSHQRLRRLLEMNAFERKTYVNLIAGPTLERIRMAERQRRQQQQNPS